MSEFKLVPAQMHLDRETIGAINFHCGDGADGQFGEYSHGLLWIGTVTDGDGKEVYGLHLATAEYPEEGSTTLVEFAAPAPPACGEAEVKRFYLDSTDGQRAQMVESQEGHYCEFEHVTRLTAERDALQQRLTAADERADVLEGLLLQTNELLYVIQGDPGAVPSSSIDAMRGEVFTALKPAQEQPKP